MKTFKLSKLQKIPKEEIFVGNWMFLTLLLPIIILFVYKLDLYSEKNVPKHYFVALNYDFNRGFIYTFIGIPILITRCAIKVKHI